MADTIANKIDRLLPPLTPEEYGSKLALGPSDPSRVVTTRDLAAHAETEMRAGSEGFMRETCDGAVGDLSTWDDQAVTAGLEAECVGLCGLDAHYPRRYHRLGTFIIESNKRFGEDDTRLKLRAKAIDKTTASWARRIAELYTYEQAVSFPSLAAVKRTLPVLQPRKPKPKPNSGNRHPAAPQAPPIPPTKEALLDCFVALGIRVKELLGMEALDTAVAQIKAHAKETFENAFEEV